MFSSYNMVYITAKTSFNVSPLPLGQVQCSHHLSGSGEIYFSKSFGGSKGNTWQCSGVPPGSTLRDPFWQCSGDRVGCQVLNPDGPHALYHCSSPTSQKYFQIFPNRVRCPFHSCPFLTVQVIWLLISSHQKQRWSLSRHNVLFFNAAKVHGTL